MKSDIQKTTLWVSVVQFDGLRRWIMSSTRDLNLIEQQYKPGYLTYSIPKKVTYCRTFDDKPPESGYKLIICTLKPKRAEKVIQMKNPELNDISNETSDTETVEKTTPAETLP